MEKRGRPPKNQPAATTEQEMKYCLYARKSMEDEERQAMSIDSQLSEMRRVAERDSLEIAVIKTEAHSAKDSGTREVYNQIIEEIKEGRYNGILTWNADRLSRNAGDLGKLVDLMDRGYLREIRTFNQRFSNSPNEKFLLMILCSQAKLENDNKSVNVARGLRMLASLGLRPGSAPTGYINSPLKSKRGHVEIDPVRAPIIRMIFEKTARDGWPTRAVYRWLTSIGFKGPNGKPFSLSNVNEVLNRTFYYGAFEFPKGSGNWYKGVHTPIITKALFDAAKKRRDVYKMRRKENLHTFPFVRMLKCGLCGSGVTASEKFKHQQNGNVHRYVYYGCTRSRDTECKARYMKEEEMLIQLADIVEKLDIDLLGMRERLEREIERWYKIHGFLIGQPVPDRSRERREDDLRRYAKAIFLEGTIPEKKDILEFLKSKLVMKDARIFLDEAAINQNTANAENPL
jgi:site-specific DNA recombinase